MLKWLVDLDVKAIALRLVEEFKEMVMELNQQLNLIHDKLNRSIQTNMSNTKAIQMVQNILKDMAYQMESMDKKHKQTIGMLGALVGVLKDLSPELKEEMKS